MPVRFGHILRALRAITTREMTKFVQQRGRLLSALVRPLIWLAVFAAGFYNVFGVSIIPPYKTYVTYQVYIVPGLLGMILSVPRHAVLAVDGLRPRDGRDAAPAHGAAAALGTAGLQARGRNCALGHHLLRVSRRLHSLRRHVRTDRLACGVSGADRLRPDAWCAVAVPVGLYPPGGEFRRRDEFRDVSDVLLLLGALSAVAAARGRLANCSTTYRSPIPSPTRWS